MTKTVLINLGKGDLLEGFPRITAQLWTAGHPLPEQYIGSLPAAPTLLTLYRDWQLLYRGLCQRLQTLSLPVPAESWADDELEIVEEAATNVSVASFNAVGQQLVVHFNAWLKANPFRNLDRQLRSHLNPSEEIRVIIETEDAWLRRLPWQQWELFKDYPRAEMALFSPEFKRQGSVPRRLGTNVRILAILGNCQGIDLTQERRFLNSLNDAEVTFLVRPLPQDVKHQLRQAEG